MQPLDVLITKNGKANGDLIGQDGNPFSIIAYTTVCLRRARWSNEDIKEFQKIATSGDYENVIYTCDSVLE